MISLYKMEYVGAALQGEFNEEKRVYLAQQVEYLNSLSSMILPVEKILEYIANLFYYHYDSQESAIHEFVEQLIRLGNDPKALLDLSERYRSRVILQTTGVKVKSREEIEMEIESRLREQKFDGVSYLVDQAVDVGFDRETLIRTFADGYINDRIQKSISTYIVVGRMDSITQFIEELKLFDSIKFTNKTYDFMRSRLNQWKRMVRDRSREIPVLEELFRELKRLGYSGMELTI